MIAEVIIFPLALVLETCTGMEVDHTQVDRNEQTIAIEMRGECVEGGGTKRHNVPLGKLPAPGTYEVHETRNGQSISGAILSISANPASTRLQTESNNAEG